MNEVEHEQKRVDATIVIYLKEGSIVVTPTLVEFKVPEIRPRHITLTNSVNQMIKEIINRVRALDGQT